MSIGRCMDIQGVFTFDYIGRPFIVYFLLSSGYVISPFASYVPDTR